MPKNIELSLTKLLVEIGILVEEYEQVNTPLGVTVFLPSKNEHYGWDGEKFTLIPE